MTFSLETKIDAFLNQVREVRNSGDDTGSPAEDDYQAINQLVEIMHRFEEILDDEKQQISSSR